MPLAQVIHLTAAFSNAVLVAIMPQISDFSKKLDLPIQQPITLSQVIEFKQSPVAGAIGGGVIVTNSESKFWFSYGNGCVNGFRMNHNPFLDDDPASNWPHYAYGKNNMTTNEAIVLARDSLKKLGLDPKLFHADLPPTVIAGPYDLKNGNHVPYCEIRWDSPLATTLEEQQNSDHLHFQINLEKKTLIALTIISKKIWQPDPKVDVQPELESDYRKRIQGKMFVRTNTPAANVPQ